MGLKNDRLIRALLRQPVDRTPVWIMRQAGRYLPEYRATRAKAGSFIALCSTPELACEVTLQPLRRFALDAAILFSDILTIPDAMGLGLQFTEGEGPGFTQPITSGAMIEQLPIPDPEIELRYVLDAVRLIRRELNNTVPLIGFAGSPWTLATYMVEGGSSQTFSRSKRLLYDHPADLHRLLEKNARAITHYLNAQIAAGADAVMLFDTWGGILTPEQYVEFSLHYMRQIIEQLTRQRSGVRIPIILFTKNGGAWLKTMADSGCDALGVDWTTALHNAKQQVQDRVALQGNLDPAALYASPVAIEAAVAKVLADFGPCQAGQGHVFNLGHGIQPQINPEHVAAMVDAVHTLSPQYHSYSDNPEP